jgi:hypothetical protein
MSNESKRKSKEKPNYTKHLIRNLNKHTYAKLAVFSGKLGFRAIKDIPPNTNPFVLTNNQNIFYDFVELAESDIEHLDMSIKLLIRQFLCSETHTYFIPFFGLNTMNFIIYIRFSSESSESSESSKTYTISEANLMIDESVSDVELFGFRTIRLIKKGEELVGPSSGFKFNIDKIRSKFVTNLTDEIANRKHLTLDSLSKIYCKIGPTTIPNITGSGVIAIRTIPPNTNPFSNTNDACYIYNSVNISKKRIDELTDKEVLKIVRDFISPDEQNKYSIPYFGFNSLNVSFFLNHSKIPNLDVVSDKCEYMGFRTNRQINAGEELFINYADYTDNFEELMNFQQT